MKHYSTYQSQFIEMFGQVSEESPCLNDIARVYDGTHKTPTYTDSGIPFISVENITDIYSSQKYISREDYELYKHKPEHGDIFMTRIGSIGKCAVYESFEPLAYYVSLALIKPNKDIVHPKFLKYYIESSDGAFELRKRSLLKAFPMKINLGEIGKIKVIVPAKDKQLEFVKIAEQADKSKFSNLKSQFIEMFGDQNTNDKGWSESLVKDEFRLSMGKTPARNNPECWDNGNHKWVSISDMSSYARYTGDTGEYITDYAIADSGIKAVPKGTIIMSFKLSIGRTAVTSEDIYTNEAIMAFADFDEKKFNIDFLHFLIANKNWLLGAKQAVKGQTLNKESIGNAKIIIPPIEMQEQFACIYNQADKSKFELRKSIEAIDAVIKNLING